MRRVDFKSGRQPHCKQMNAQSREREEKQRKEEQKKKEGNDNLWAFFAEVLQFPHTYEALVNHNI